MKNITILACLSSLAFGCSNAVDESKPNDATISFALDSSWSEAEKLPIEEAMGEWGSLGAQFSIDSGSPNIIKIDNSIGADHYSGLTTQANGITTIRINLAFIEFYCYKDENPSWYPTCLRVLLMHELGHAIKIGGSDLDSMGHINDAGDVMCHSFDCNVNYISDEGAVFCLDNVCKRIELSDKDKNAYWAAYPNSQGLKH